MTDPDPTDKPTPPTRPKPVLDPANYGWLVAALGVGSAVLGSPVLATACFTAMAVWIAATIKLGLEMSLMGLLGEILALVAVVVAYGCEQLWILLRGRFRRDYKITKPLMVLIIGEHVLFFGVLSWLLLRVLVWVRDVQAGGY